MRIQACIKWWILRPDLLALAEYAGPIPRLVVPMEEPPNSISFNPSTIWWKSKTIWALSDTNILPVESKPNE